MIGDGAGPWISSPQGPPGALPTIARSTGWLPLFTGRIFTNVRSAMKKGPSLRRGLKLMKNSSGDQYFVGAGGVTVNE